MDRFLNDTNDAWLLGRVFDMSRNDERIKFFNNWSSLILFTYKKNFVPIDGTTITSDAGWGCTLRTAQMYIANAIMLYLLGNDPSAAKKYKNVKLNIIKLFNDNPSNPFAIHAFSLCGTEFNKAVGEWHGPHTAAKIIKYKYKKDFFSVYVCDDRVIYKDEILKLNCKGIVILISLCFGVGKFNNTYVDTLKHYFKIPNFMGIIGGKSNSSYFFAGLQSNYLLYFNPHKTQNYVEINDDDDDDIKKEFVLQTFSADKTHKTPIDSIDPSIVIGFYCKNMEDYDSLVERFKNTNENVKQVFFFANERPKNNSGDVKDVQVDEELFTLLK